MVAKKVAKKLAKKKKVGTAISAIAVARAARTIRAETIWARLRAILGPVSPGDGTEAHIGNAQAVHAFANVLNGHPPFLADGLALTPGNLHGCTTIGCIAAAIIAWYQRNGWRVVAA